MKTPRKESLLFFGVQSAFLILGLVTYFAALLITKSYPHPLLQFFAEIGLAPTLCLYGILACVTAAILLQKRSSTP